jgi:hypothetical protein
MQVLVDADNVDPTRVSLVLAALPVTATVVAAGRRSAISAVDWPAGATLLQESGWQRADLALAAAYVPSDEPLLLVSGDSDFALLAARHAGPVLVVSEAPSHRLRAVVPVHDPAVDDPGDLRRWIDAVTGA